jgi:hypothetical protein
MGERVTNYINLYIELSESRNKIIDEMYQALIKIEKEYKTSSGKVSAFCNIEKLGNTIRFQFLDFNVCIELEICTSKEGGFIKWYRTRQDFDPKLKKNLIIKDSFNNHGEIKTSWKSSMGFNIQNITSYLNQALITFCERNDEIDFK